VEEKTAFLTLQLAQEHKKAHLMALGAQEVKKCTIFYS
jgi:hypothetical protein